MTDGYLALYVNLHSDSYYYNAVLQMKNWMHHSLL